MVAGDIVDARAQCNTSDERRGSGGSRVLRESKAGNPADDIGGAPGPACCGRRSGIGKWAKITRPVILLYTGQSKARDRVIQIDLEHEEPLVIAETDVVAGMEFLDEFALEQEGLRFAPDDMNIKVVDRFNQRLELQIPAETPRRLKIVAHPLAQISRFTHVDHRPKTITHQVDSGLVRERVQFLADIFGH